MNIEIQAVAPDQNAQLSQQLGQRVRAAREEKGQSIRAAARQLRCSPRFLLQLEQGKPTARMDKVLQTLSGLGLQLSVGAEQGAAPSAPVVAQIEARDGQRLYGERLARAHDRIAARLALDAMDLGDIERARDQVRKWADQHICSQWYVDEWTRILGGSGREIAAKMLALGKADSSALFQNTPFAFLVRRELRA